MALYHTAVTFEPVSRPDLPALAIVKEDNGYSVRTVAVNGAVLRQTHWNDFAAALAAVASDLPDSCDIRITREG